MTCKPKSFTDTATKILFFIPRMGGGGAERVVANLSNDFTRRGYSVVIYTPTDNNSYYELDSKIKILGEGYHISKRKILRQVFFLINGIRLWFAYKRRIKKEKPDIIISFLTATNCIALTHRYERAKLIVSERNDPTKYGKLTQYLLKHLYPKANVLVCQSNAVASFFECKNTKIIPNPIDYSVLPAKYDGPRRKVICAIGRLMPQKNFANLIKAFWKLDSRFEDYTLEIYGEGPLRNELNKLILSLGLSGRIKLMGAHSNVLELIKDTSLFVMSSDYEGYPNALIEAMAIGLPVISTDFASGVANELIGEENGIIVSVGDEVALSEAIAELLMNENRRKDMSESNREKVTAYSISNIAPLWLEGLK